MHCERVIELSEGASFKPLFGSEKEEGDFYDWYCDAVRPQMKRYDIARANSILESMFRIVD